MPRIRGTPWNSNVRKIEIATRELCFLIREAYLLFGRHHVSLPWGLQERLLKLQEMKMVMSRTLHGLYLDRL
jgi:hypothetical protein